MQDNNTDLNEVKNLNKVKKTNPVEDQADKPKTANVGIENEDMDLEDDETSDVNDTIDTAGESYIPGEKIKNPKFTEGKRGV